MYKYLFLLLLIALMPACKKHNQNGCPAKACTYVFASISVNFVDKDGKPVPAKDVKAINKRTGKQIIASSNGPAVPGVGPNIFTIATDNNKNEFSADGDDVELTATNATTNQTKITLFKISGGCNCHIDKVSGPEKIVLE
ncbi:hypothetical protein [Mucilaginibacter celer]|nr:hypothetical protein [Mucilaginibacter celer]